MKFFHMSNVFLIVISMTTAHFKNYDGAQVFTINPTSEIMVDQLKSLHQELVYDFWTPPVHVGKPVDIMAKGHQIAQLKATLTELQIPYEIKVENMNKHLSDNFAHNEMRRRQAPENGKAMEWTAYHTFDEINDWMDMIADQYSEFVTVEDVGVSFEGRVIKRMLVSTGGSAKPVIFVESGCHAREWIGPATTTYIMNELITNSEKYQDSLDAVDFVFMPEVNPDGYNYSWVEDRLWRKNRKPSNESTCIGVDLNRNYDYFWGGQGASEFPCFDTYRGTEAFSEVEAQVVRDQMLQFSDNNMVYISFHSALEEWLRPWSYLYDTAGPDEEDVAALCESAVEALYQVHGVQFICILGGNLYPAAGVSDDYAKGVANFKYSYAVELRDQGYSFELPPEQIIPSGEETFAAFQVVFEFIRDNPSG